MNKIWNVRCGIGLGLIVVAGQAVALHASPQDPAVAGGIDSIDETLLGPGAPAGGRPDGLSEPDAKASRWQDRFALTIGVDWTNAYFWRGFRQEDEGFIVQPWASLSFAAVKTDDLTLNINAGTWHSFHDNRTAAAVADDFYQTWYEADYSLGASVTAGTWTVGATYSWFGSPSGAFTRIEELTVAASLDDSQWLGAWALKPSVQVSFDTANGTGDGRDRGVYLQLGIVPGFDLPVQQDWTIRVDVPVVAGFSLSDYYQDGTGADDFFGFVQAGPKMSMPLPLPDGWGTWTFSGSASWLHASDHPAALNGGENNQWIFTAGVSVAF
jgi:hypothetical protein